MRLASLPMHTKAHFFEDVYEIVKRIPPGRVTTYGAIAHCLGVKGSARMVGWALHQVAQHPEIPAHRVVNCRGLLTGKHHFAGKATMEQRLASESVRVCNDQIQGFAQLFWDPLQIGDALV